MSEEQLDYSLVGLTLPELAAARDAAARDLDERGTDAPDALREAVRKLTYYHDQRLKSR